MTAVFIYALTDPSSGSVRYVGKSKKPRDRFSQHMYQANTRLCPAHLYRWIRKLVRAGMAPGLIVLEETDEDAWVAREMYWISFYGRKTLINKNDGGSQPPDMTGRKKTPEEIEKSASARRGKPQWSEKRPHPLLGKVHPRKGTHIHTADRRRAFSEAKVGANNPNYRKPVSVEHKAAIKKKLGRRVEQMDEAGNTVAVYATQRDAERAIGLPQGSVSRICNGQYSQFRGFRFRRCSA